MDKSERLLEAAAAILDAAPDKRLKAVILNKALFYLDLATLRDRGETITDTAYIALENGPVVTKYQSRLIKKLGESGIATQGSEWDGSLPLTLERLPELTLFEGDRERLKLTAAVTQFFAKMTSTQASDYSHENPGWEAAWKERIRIGKPVAIDMNIALQQIVEDDPWMYEPLVDNGLLEAADANEGLDW